VHKVQYLLYFLVKVTKYLIPFLGTEGCVEFMVCVNFHFEMAGGRINQLINSIQSLLSGFIGHN